MTDRIEISWHKLAEQAPWTASHYLTEAKKAIDDKFGENYAARHPELVGSFMKTAATDFLTSAISVAAQNIRDVLRQPEPLSSDE